MVSKENRRGFLKMELAMNAVYIQSKFTKLVEESLKSASDSSRYCVEMLTDGLLAPTVPEFIELPKGYGKNTIAVLPVNTESLNVYREIEEQTVHRFERFGALHRQIRLYEYESGHDSQLAAIDTDTDIGSDYFGMRLAKKTLFCALGFMDSFGHFTEVVRSKSIVMPSDELTINDNDVWLRREDGWNHILRSSLSGISFGGSSENYDKEMEFLRKYKSVGTRR